MKILWITIIIQENQENHENHETMKTIKKRITITLLIVLFYCLSAFSQNSDANFSYDTLDVKSLSLFSNVCVVSDLNTVLSNLGEPDTIMVQKHKVVFFNENNKVDSVKHYDIYLFKTYGIAFFVEKNIAILSSVDFRTYNNVFLFDDININNKKAYSFFKKNYPSSYSCKSKIKSSLSPWIYGGCKKTITIISFTSNYGSYRKINFYFKREKLVYLDFDIY